MSRRSQARRAARAKDRAKQRARTQKRSRSQGPTPAGFGPGAHDAFDEGLYAESPLAQFGRAKFRSRHAVDYLEAVRGGTPLMMLLPEASRIDAATFCAEAEPILIAWVRELYGAGWQPTELIRRVRMRAKTAAADLIRRAVAAERGSRTGPTANDPLWEQQWSAAELPAPPEAGWVAAWADALPAGQESPVRRLLYLAMVLGRMPVLELLLPPPPGVRTSTAPAGRPAAATTDPVLERVRALLAKAESTDHEPEALAFTAKAQELMTKHAIDVAVHDGTTRANDTPHVIRIPIDAPYADVKALLVQIVAQQTRCRTAYHSNVAMTSVIGFATDLEAVELLFTSLLIQAQHALVESSADAPPGSRTRSQAYRAAFLSGFAGRIDERLTEVNRLAYADAQGEAFLPVLRSQDAKIEEFVDQRFGEMSSSRVRGGYDPVGYARGELAGDAAALTSGAVEEAAG